MNEDFIGFFFVILIIEVVFVEECLSNFLLFVKVFFGYIVLFVKLIVLFVFIFFVVGWGFDKDFLIEVLLKVLFFDWFSYFLFYIFRSLFWISLFGVLDCFEVDGLE